MSEHSLLDGYAVSEFERDAKIGLLATVDAAGRPHLSLITSLQAKAPAQLVFGQFCEGWSKDRLRENPQAAFCVMNQNKEVWRGNAQWTDSQKSGADYELYNQKPMFRYNSYFGIHTVHYLDLVACRDKEKLSVGAIAAGLFTLPLVRAFSRGAQAEAALKPWAEKLVTANATLKFLSWLGDDGFPTIVPAVPATVLGARRLLFVPSVYRAELRALPLGRDVAVFAVNLQMESVLMRGRFGGYRRHGGLRAGAIDIDWVYNSMPPKHGPIYPLEPVAAVERF